MFFLGFIHSCWQSAACYLFTGEAIDCLYGEGVLGTHHSIGCGHLVGQRNTSIVVMVVWWHCCCGCGDDSGVNLWCWLSLVVHSCGLRGW